MRTIETTFNTFGASLLLIGLKGESNATEILIDCADALEEYQGTMAAMSITGPDGTVYPGDISLDEDGVVHWVVAERDCGIDGHGSARVDLVDDNGTVVASAEADTMVIKTKMQNIAPDQIENWTDAASVALQEVRAALVDLINTDSTATANEAARQLAETGRVSAETLRASAETARASAETARATAETARASAETARATAETARASAETDRIAAETARVNEFSTIEANAQAALSYIGPSEASSTASAVHAAGSYFIYNGKLNRATADIAVGDTIASGTNCEQVSGGAMGEVSDSKNALAKYESMTNDGQYIIQVSDLESGQWSYSTKTANTARGRTKYLIPVRAGMAVSYDSDNYEVFIGVLATPTSSTYAQNSGWKNGVGTFAVSTEGYMTFIIRNHENTSATVDVTEFNGTVTIYTKEKYEQTKAVINGTGVMFQQCGVSSATGQLYGSKKHITSGYITLPQGNYRIETEDEYKPFVCIKSGDNFNLVECWNGSIIPVITGYEYAFVLMHIVGGTEYGIRIEEGQNIRVVAYKPHELTKKEFENPVSILSDDVKNILLYEFPYVGYRIGGSSNGLASEVIRMPKSGLYIGALIVDGLNFEDSTYGVKFFRINDGVFVPATDYEYAGVNWNAVHPNFVPTKLGFYFPYSEGLYFQVYKKTSTTDDIAVNFFDEDQNNGRLLTLSIVGMKKTVRDNIAYFTPTFSGYSSGYAPLQYMYGSVIRLGDAKSVACTPKYSISAWVYDNNDELIANVNGTDAIYVNPSGTGYIDLSAYKDDEGYAVIVINATQYRKNGSIECDTMGILGMHDDVLNNVFVDYYNKTIIQHTSGMNHIIARNIETLKRIKFPETLAFGYRGNWTRYRVAMKRMKDSTLGYYGGRTIADVPFSNVSMKSYATAMKNHNSRIYAGDWEVTNPNGSTLPQKLTGAISDNYGFICSNIPQILCGIKEATSMHGFYTFSNYWGFETEEVNMATYAEKIKPGDWFIGRPAANNDTDYHVCLVTDIIHINGMPFCLELLESYPPFVRYRYFYLYEPFTRFNSEYSAAEADGYFNLIARPPIEKLQLIRDIWDTDTDYDVGTLMCDRGTDSVYCTGNTHCYITIADDTMTSFDIWVNGANRRTVTIENRTLITFGDHALEGIDIISDIRDLGAGYYTLIPNNKNTVQESFYVPPTPSNMTINVLETTVEITPDITQDIVQFTAYYYSTLQINQINNTETITVYNPDSDEYETVEISPSGSDVAEDIGTRLRISFSYSVSAMRNGKLTLPKSVVYKDYYYQFDYCEIVYSTDYGTFIFGQDIGGNTTGPDVWHWCNSDRMITEQF